MKKFLNKLSSSGNLRDDSHDEEEHLDTHYRKSSALPTDAKDTSEDFKLKKSWSMSKASSPRYKEAMETDDFSKKKSVSGGVKKDKEKEKEKDKDKLNESDDKMRKSFSLRTVSLFKSSDQVKNSDGMRSPSLKNIFTPQYNQHRDALDDSSSDEEEDAFVPRNNSNARDEVYSYSPSSSPIRVPSAPGRMASSPQPTLNPRPMSPSSPSTTKTPQSPTMSHSHSPSPLSFSSTPTAPHSYSPPHSPFINASPSNARVPAFTQSPPVHALVITPQQSTTSPTTLAAGQPTSPHVIVADTFDARFAGSDAGRLRTDSITDDYGAGAFRNAADSDSDSEQGEDVEMSDDPHIYQKKKGFFNSNKPRKLKA